MSTAREISKQIATTASGTGAVTIVPASGNGAIFRDLAGITITTVNAAAATLTISDGTNNVMVIDYPNAAVAPSAPFDLDFNPPLEQNTANKAWTITASVNGTNFHVNANYLER